MAKPEYPLSATVPLTPIQFSWIVRSSAIAQLYLPHASVLASATGGKAGVPFWGQVCALDAWALLS